MIRCSELLNILTNKPIDNSEKLLEISSNLYNLCEEKKLENIDLTNDTFINSIKDTKGFITIVKTFIDEKSKYDKYQNDDLSEAIKNNIQKIWLQENYYFIPYTKKDEVYSLFKGIYLEDEAIKMLNLIYNKNFVKNKIRFKYKNLSGEPDVIDDDIHDVKVSLNWETFREVKELSNIYYWQMLGYLILTNKTKAFVHYCLIGSPEILPKYYSNYVETERIINSIDIKDRIKTFEVSEQTYPTLREDIKFIFKRLNKVQEYYNSLDYYKCMNL